MNTNQKELVEVRELILTAQLGKLSEEQRLRLSELVASSADAATEAAALLDQQAALRDGMRAMAQERSAINGETPLAKKIASIAAHNLDVVERVNVAKYAMIRRYLPAIAACLLISHLGAGGLAWWFTQPKDASLVAVDSSEQAGEALPEGRPLAPHLVAMTGCVWDPKSPYQPHVGAPLEMGQVLDLREGIASFELGFPSEDRARVRVEGPASLFVRSDGFLGVRYGVLRADVQWRSGKFAIDTPAGKVTVPENASLGVIADGDANEVHVFQGKAEVASLWDEKDVPITLLCEGEAVALSNADLETPGVERLAASEERFAFCQTMALDRLDLDLTYESAVLESEPAVYWRFEQEGRSIANLGNRSGLEAHVLGELAWDEFIDNRVAEFGTSTRPTALISRETWPVEPLDEYSIELWVKPSHFHNGALIGLVGQRLNDQRYPHSMLIQLGGHYLHHSPQIEPFELRYLHRGPLAQDPLLGTSCYGKSDYAVRRWQHVVTRKQEGKMFLYVNGEMVDSQSDETPLPSGTRVLVGQLYPAFPVIEQRRFVGQIDEIALYERALSEGEIRRHFELAVPRYSDDDSI